MCHEGCLVYDFRFSIFWKHHIACQLSMKHLSHTSLSFPPEFITKHCGVTYRFSMHLASHHGRGMKYCFLSSLFIVLAIFSMFWSMEKWFPYVRKSRNFLYDEEAFTLLRHPTSNSLLKYVTTCSLHFDSFRTFMMFLVSLYSPVKLPLEIEPLLDF